MTLLILGANGFIGRNLREQLQSPDMEILAPMRDELDVLDADATRAYLQRTRPDALVYCLNRGGTRTTSHLTDIVSSNMRMFAHVMRAREYFGKLIFLGSGAEYGKQVSLDMIREAEFDTRVPADDYGLYKYLCAKELAHDDNPINLRLFGVYGPHEDYTIRFPSYAILSALLGAPITIRQNTLFDYLFVNDVADVIRWAVQSFVPQRVYNVASGTPVSLLDFAQLVNKTLETDVPITVTQGGMGKSYTADISRLQQDYPSFTPTPLVEGITALAAFYRERLDTIDRSAFVLPT